LTESELRRELEQQRLKLHRYQVYLGAALAVFGLGTLAALGLLGLYGFRLSSALSELQARLDAVESVSHTRTEELGVAIARQKQELAAIRKSATEDLEAIREAQRKLAAVRDPVREISALRDANAALWEELANQKAELLDALQEREGGAMSGAQAPQSRFRLGETTYEDPKESSEPIKGFIPAGEKVYRATAVPVNPAVLLIELSPDEVGLGDPYELSVRIVNRSNQTLVPASLRLEWSFNGRNTGGNVPVGASRVDAQQSALLYAVSGRWSEAQRGGPGSVTATVTLDGGARLSNTLQW
jgi:hypothetical protein